MTKNQKIALGCGGAGCLGLIFIIIVGAVIWWLVQARPALSGRFSNFNVSTNRNTNSDSDSNSNSNTTSNSNSNSEGSSSTSSTSMSDDDKHKLYQAATMTGDTELVHRVSIKLGLMKEDFTPNDEYVGFIKDHIVWALSNGDFIQSLNTKEKAVAYVNEHIPD